MAIEHPVPQTAAIAVFVPLVRPLNAVVAPELPQSDPSPETTPVLLTCRHCVPPPVTLVVMFPLAESVVNAPAAGVPEPIEGGAAKSARVATSLPVPLLLMILNR